MNVSRKFRDRALQIRARRAGVLPWLAIALLWLSVVPGPADAARLKDLASVTGVRSNQVIGYGLVVGLRGTGDKLGVPFTTQSLRSLLAKMGISIDSGLIRIKNVAAVMVTATLPAFARTGGTIDAVVSSIGDAKSLEDGMLLMTPLIGTDGQIYAIAQGSVSVGGFSIEGGGASVSQNHPTVGTVIGGAIVEREVAYSLTGRRDFEIALHQPDFTTAERTAKRINEAFAESIATARDAGTLDLVLPDAYTGNVVGFLARVELLDVKPDVRARIVLNERTGTIVMGEAVRVSTVAVAHGNLTVIVNRTNQISQPGPFSDGETARLQNTEIEAFEESSKLSVIETTVTIGELVRALNAMGTTPTDLISIIQAIKASGSLSAEVEMM